MSKAAGI